MDYKEDDNLGSSPEKTVPLERFQEVYGEMKALKDEVNLLKEKSDTQPGGLTPQQKQELEAKEYLAKLIDERLTETSSKREQEEVKELQEFASELETVLEMNSSVDKEQFMKFLEEEADNYDVSSVKGAMAVFKKINSSTEEGKVKAKEDLARKPNLPSSDFGGGKSSYEDKGKSFYQIAEETKKLI